jgi:acetylornithine deacetylase/succinyl-diaminopimelate desuccinylase-like protein
MMRYFRFLIVIGLFLFSGIMFWAEESLFTPKLVSSSLVQSAFKYVDKNKEKIIEDWIKITEIPAPSGEEEKRAQFIEEQFRATDLDKVYRDKSGNVIGIWKGKEALKGRKIILSAHLDTVFQGVMEIKVKREKNVLKAPGIGDNSASVTNLLWLIRTLKHTGFKPDNTYYFLATVGEEVGFTGMRHFLEETKESFDLLIALDGDLGKVHYGGLGFGGGEVIFRGPGAHTMQSRGVPNPNLAVAKAIERIYSMELISEPPEKWTIINIGIIKGGKVPNAVSQESSFRIDLRSANQKELESAQKIIMEICQDVASEVGVKVEMDLNYDSKAHQIPGAGSSYLVKTAVDILEYLEVHSLREEARIDGLFLSLKQDLLLVFALK